MEIQSYQNILKKHPYIIYNNSKNLDSSIYSEQIISRSPWEERLSKAVYYGELLSVRQIVFDQAILYPDLIEAKWKCTACEIGDFDF